MTDTAEREGYQPVCRTVIWDDSLNPDIRLIRAISALIDASDTMTDPEIDAVLEYMVKRRSLPQDTK